LGCDDGDQAATPVGPGEVELTCAERADELAAQCPPGSDPVVGPAAMADCQGAGGELTDPDGAVRGICASADSCVVLCNFRDPCACGIDRITDEGVFCAECIAGCGNGLCEGGESPQTCPEDCGSICTPGAERCADSAREICEVDGDWGRAECRRDQACDVLGSLTYCQTRVSPDGGTWVDPGGEAQAVEGEPSEVRFQAGDICADCEPLRFVDDGTRILALSNNTLQLIDPASGAVEETPFTVQGDFAVTEQHVATSARLPVVVDRARATTFTAAAFVDDTTRVVTGAVALTPDGGDLAVAMAVQDTPLVALWDTEEGAARHLLRFVDEAAASNDQATALAFSPNGALLVEGRNDGTLVVWNVEEGRYIHLIQSDVAAVTGLHFTPDGDLLVAGQSGVERWQLEMPERMWRQAAASRGFALSPDGAVIASREDGIRLRDATTGQMLRRLDSQGRVHFSPDGRRLMAGRVIFQDSF
jgi:WD40 repeat protein